MGSLRHAARDQYSAGSTYSGQILQEEVNNQFRGYDQQQALAQQLQQQAAGQGPNPSQLQYQANTQNNLANTQGMIASQRGLNPALAARMGANAGAVASQQSALGSALLQQNQQIAAQNSLGGLYGQMQEGNLKYQGLWNQTNEHAQDINAGVAAQNTKNATQLIGGLVSGGAAAGGIAARGAHGGRIAGKPSDGPDKLENDTVPIMAQPGEILIPNSKAHDPEKAKGFIDHLLKSKEKKRGYGDVVAARRKKAS